MIFTPPERKPNHTHTQRHMKLNANFEKARMWQPLLLVNIQSFGPIIYCLVLLRQLVLKC